jgi:hypothetical protein
MCCGVQLIGHHGLVNIVDPYIRNVVTLVKAALIHGPDVQYVAACSPSRSLGPLCMQFLDVPQIKLY